jgi:glucosylceramidase
VKTRRLLLITICLVSTASIRAQEVRVYVTSAAGDRLSLKAPSRFGNSSGQTDFQIDESKRDQEIVGFGASFLESGMICLNSLAPANQEKVLAALFDPDRGAGFSAMKTVIAATDFMSAGPFYSVRNGHSAQASDALS